MPATNCSNLTVCGVEQGFKAEAQALGAKGVVLENGAANPIADAIKNMDQLTAEHVNAEAFWPLDPTAMVAPTRRAKQAGIPVFAHDLYATSNSGVVTSVTEGRELVAKQAAGLMCAQHKTGEVIYGNFALPAPTLNFLHDKFASYLKQCSGGKLSVAATFLNKTDDVAGSRPNAQAALQAHPNAVGIMDYNDPTAIGASLAAASLGVRNKLLITGYNLAPNGIEALHQGRIDYSWDYRPIVIGQILARTMIEYLAKKNTHPPAVIMVWPKCYSKATVGQLVPASQQLSEVAHATDLSAADPQLVQTGSSVPSPSASLPGCPTQ